MKTTELFSKKVLQKQLSKFYKNKLTTFVSISEMRIVDFLVRKFTIVQVIIEKIYDCAKTFYNLCYIIKIELILCCFDNVGL